MTTAPATTQAPWVDSVAEREELGLLILSPAGARATRRVLFINVSGGRAAWARAKSGLMPTNRLWGCLELVRRGYEVAIAEALPDFYLWRNPLPHDLRLLQAARSWLGPDGIVYCAHNTLYWLPALKAAGLLRRRIVSLLYAREPLDWARAHAGIVALNPAAADHARQLAPHVKVAHLGWGLDLPFYPRLAYAPEFFLSCGRTNRDVPTLNRAAAQCRAPIEVIAHEDVPGLAWTANVRVVDGGPGWESRLPYRDLLHDHYGRAAASLVVVDADPVEYTACGFTGLLEAMTMARPVIMTRTGAVPTEIDIEQAGCGVFVPPGDPAALARAIDALAADPERARVMGEAGRRLCESHYNSERFGRELCEFFETL